MTELIEKLRKARQQQITVEGVHFTVQRPTDLQIAEQGANNFRQSDVLQQYVVGWDQVTEITLGIPGGTASPVPFDSALFVEWVADNPNFWGPLCDKITELYQQHIKKLAANEKKPDAG